MHKAIDCGICLIFEKNSIRYLFCQLKIISSYLIFYFLLNWICKISKHAHAIKRFLDSGGVIARGLFPTNYEPFETENTASLAGRLEEIGSILSSKGIDGDWLFARRLLSPATCCLVNPDGEKTVEAAFKMVKELSAGLREKYHLA